MDTTPRPQQSVLYDQHILLTGGRHMADFAGYRMPLWYSSISAEHRAVREKAGLFDCTHMGVLDFTGPGAGDFLDYVTTNKVAGLIAGRAQYSYLLNAAGHIIDDIIVYHLDSERFMAVVNAANDPAVQRHIKEQLSQWAGADVRMRDLRNPTAGDDQRVDIALQGPASLDVLESWAGKGELIEQAVDLKPFAFFETQVNQINVVVARTGYTGAKVGFELLVHPRWAGQVWEELLKVGEPLGLLPCGLGSRDSLRIEAGLPLYGHELAGEYDISPFEAGYGWAVKLDKEYFIGIEAMRQKAAHVDMQVARITFPGGKGIRPLRPGDPVLDDKGTCIGWLLSSTTVDDRQIALAYVGRDCLASGDTIASYYLARSQRHVEQGKKEKVEKGELVEAEITGEVLERFEKF